MSDDPERSPPQRLPSSGGRGPLAALFTALAAGVLLSLFLLFRSAAPDAPAARRLELSFTGCPGADVVVRGRLERLGLAHVAVTPRPGGFTAAGPYEGDPALIPWLAATLAATGRREIVAGPYPGGPLLADDGDVEEARFSADEGGWTEIELSKPAAEAVRMHREQDPEGAVTIWMDGEPVGALPGGPFDPGAPIRLDPGAPSGDARLHEAARQAAILNGGTMPCAVEVAVAADDRSAR